MVFVGGFAAVDVFEAVTVELVESGVFVDVSVITVVAVVAVAVAVVGVFRLIRFANEDFWLNPLRFVCGFLKVPIAD